MDTIEVRGVRRALGCMPRISRCGDGTFPVVSEKWRIDEKHWGDAKYKEVANRLKALIWHVINQGSQGSCTMCGTLGALKIARRFSGLDDIVFSQGSLYAYDSIGSNGEPNLRSSDNGTAIDQGLAVLRVIGACPAKIDGKTYIDQYDWQGLRRGNWPADHRRVAALNRALKWVDVPDAHLAISLTKHGIPVVYGANGHCVVRVTEDEDLNSWDYDWGTNGIGQWVNRRGLESGIRQYGAWALLTSTDPLYDGDVPNV